MLTESTTGAESSPESQEEGPESRQESQEDLLNVDLESQNYHLQNKEMRNEIETSFKYKRRRKGSFTRNKF